MTWLLGLFTGSKLARWLAMASAALIAILTFGKLQKRAGRKDERQRAKEADNERAKSIRDNVERELPERLRDFDGRGFRDSG